MRTLTVNIQNRVAVLTTSGLINSGSVNSDQITFTVDSEWDSLTTRKAYFYTNENTCYFVDLSGSIAKIPAIVLDRAGTFYCGLIGESGGTRLTSSPVAISVGKGASPNDMIDAAHVQSLLDTIAAIRGVKTITPYFAVGPSKTTAPSDDQFKPETPTIDAANKYIWFYLKIIYTTNEVERTNKSIIGLFGRGIESTTYYWAVSTSASTVPSRSEFGTSPVTPTPTKPILWAYVAYTYTDGTTHVTDPFVVGSLGRGVETTKYYWAINNSKLTSPRTSEFGEYPLSPTPTDPVLWAYVVHWYTDGTTKTTEPFVIGTMGERGPKGERGFKGDPGEDSPDLFTIKNWIKEEVSMSTSVPFDSGYQTEDGYIHLTNNGVDIDGFIPFQIQGGGGGGGGSTGNQVKFTMNNTTGWLIKTVAEGQSCPISFMWSSIDDGLPTGPGTVKMIVGGSVASTMSVQQGVVEIDAKKYIIPGTNSIQLNLTDSYGNNKYIIFTIRVVSVGLSSTFEPSATYSGAISFPYTPTGVVAKDVHFILDGEEIWNEVVKSSGRQQTYTIPAQRHGSHIFEVYFTADIEGALVESNHLRYDITCIEEGKPDPIIATDFAQSKVQQYETIPIRYRVYDPRSMTAQIALKDGDSIVGTLTVDRSLQTWSYRVDKAGDHKLSIVCGNIVKIISFNAAPSPIESIAETQDLKLYLSSYGRSNSEANPGQWEYNGVSCQFSGFNFKSDGWMTDEDNITVLRVTGDARLTIPYKIFANDFRTTGKTIEIELATRDVRDYEAVILSCLSNGLGLKVTGQAATLKSEQSELSMQYRDGEHVRLSFVVNKQSENRLMFVYINGVMSGAFQYPTNDNFAHRTAPADITIGSNDCTIDIYNIRIYDNNLNEEQLLGNWIADTQNGTLKTERYTKNNIFDDYRNIVVDKLPSDLPYIIWESEGELPQYKGNKVTVSGRYVDPQNPKNSFTFENSTLDVQGTSSQYYARKNYKQKYKTFTTANGEVPRIPLRPGAIPVNVFTYKADVASSEGANNVELIRLYHETCPVKTPAMVENTQVRWGVDGLPIAAFHKNTTTGVTTFIGKYNWNNDKSTEAVFGFKSGDESWEVLNNTSSRVLYKSDDFTGTSWANDFEARYPDGNTDSTRLKAMVSWVKSTNGNATKFKAEIADHFDVQSCLFYWLFTEMFLLVDSRAKNTFPSYIESMGVWTWFPYDMDTALGINNEGSLAFTYSLEDTDRLSGSTVFNGQDSVFWNNLRNSYRSELATMYKSLRSSGAWSFEKVSKMFTDHQSKWPVALVNEDSRFKYLDPLTESGNGSYLSMLQGLKTSQRSWWLYNRFRYMDSKYNVGDDRTDYIELRGYQKASITITPYADLYCNVKYGSYFLSQRGYRNRRYTFTCPPGLDTVNDTEIYIYSASRLASVGDLSGLKIGRANFAMAEKLMELKIGSSNSTNPNFTQISLGNNRLLKLLDLSNCSNFTQTVDLVNCKNIEEVRLNGTKVTGVDLPNGGMLKKLYLPSTVTNLTLQNQPLLTQSGLSMESGIKLTTLRVENTPVDIITLLNLVQPGGRVRLIGCNLDLKTTTQVNRLFARLDSCTGLSELGANMDLAQVSGEIKIPQISETLISEFRRKYPDVRITAEYLTYTVEYYNWDGTEMLYTEYVTGGDNASYGVTPTKQSTDQYNYTFVGWARSLDGVVDSGIKQSIRSNLKLYPVYTSSIRSHPVYFYNGSTLLETQTTPYGGRAKYSGNTRSLMDPSGSGGEFVGWDPVPVNVTGPLSVSAKYADPISEVEIADDWDTILANVQNGTYKDVYKVGNYKPLALESGKVLDMQIVGFDVDQKADGTGTAPISWVSRKALPNAIRYNSRFECVTHPEVREAWVWDPNLNCYRSNNAGFYAYEDKPNAISTFTLCPSLSGSITLWYKTTGGDFVLSVDGTSVVDLSYTIKDWRSYTIDAVAGKTITIKAKFDYPIGMQSMACIRFSSNNELPAIDKQGTFELQVRDAVKENTGSLGGWLNSELRRHCNTVLYDDIPSNVRNSIVPVIKTQSAITKITDLLTLESEIDVQFSEDKVWCPGVSEIFEKDQPPIYLSMRQSNGLLRRKSTTIGTSFCTWWLRDSVVDGNAVNNGNGYRQYSARTVDLSGQLNSEMTNREINYLVMGFCT